MHKFQQRIQILPQDAAPQSPVPPPEPDGPQLRAALTEQGVPLFSVDIPRLKAFEKAASAGVTVSEVDDPRAKRAWEAYTAAGKELVTHV